MDTYTEKRKSIRLYLKDFNEYSVHLDSDRFDLNCHLGNISETGMCCILERDIPFNEEDRIKGEIKHKEIGDPFDYVGRIIWKDSYSLNSIQYTAIGVRFLEPIELPEHLFALSLSIEP